MCRLCACKYYRPLGEKQQQMLQWAALYSPVAIKCMNEPTAVLQIVVLSELLTKFQPLAFICECDDYWVIVECEQISYRCFCQ